LLWLLAEVGMDSFFLHIFAKNSLFKLIHPPQDLSFPPFPPHWKKMVKRMATPKIVTRITPNKFKDEK
jgi:hypothetical protein